MGHTFSFAAEASFGSHSFTNKCPISNEHRIQQGRGLKCDQAGYKGGETKRNTVANRKFCMRSRVCLKMRNVGGFSYLHILYLKERQVDSGVEISNM